MFKKSILGLAVGLAVSVPALSAPVTFDTQTSGVITFNNLVWQGGNALVMGAMSTPLTIDLNGDGTADAQLLHTVAQARMSSFTLTNGGSLALGGNAEITYQASFWELATGIGSTTAAFTLAPSALLAQLGLSSTIDMYYQNSLAFFGNDKTGANYGAEGGATKILSGNLVSLTGNYTDFTRTGALLGGVNPWPVTHLDCDAGGSGCVGYDGIDQAPGTLTHQGNGNQQLGVDVTFYNSSFFLNDISTFVLDLSQVVGVSVPFQNANPWTTVVGETPYFSLVDGSRINGGDCGRTGGQSQGGVNNSRCDQLLQTTGLTTFNRVPEPSTIAALGLGLGLLGFFNGRKRKS